MNQTAILLALVGGVAIAMQNAVMVAMAERGLGLTTALMINSAVGLVLLIGIERYRAGPDLALELGRSAHWWFVLPGLLGTLFVFASLYGYRHQGAAVTVALIVAAQLSAGVLLDLGGLRGEVEPLNAQRLIGLALLMTGAALVVRRA